MVTESKSILITGGGGFVGQHLIQYLLDTGNTVTATYRSREIVADESRGTLRKVLVGDIDGKTDWGEALTGVSVVIHLAARAHVLDESALDPIQEFHRVNVEGTQSLLEQSIDAGIQHFVFLSSVGAMATLSKNCLHEMTPCCPDSPYGDSKLKAEKLIEKKSFNTNTHWTVFRPTLVYGPGNPGNMERLLRLVSRNIPLPLGGVKNKRSLVYVKNLVEVITRSLLNPQAYGEVFLVSDGEDVSTPSLIRILADGLDKPAFLLPIPISALEFVGKLMGKQDAMERLKGSLTVDSRKVRQALDWSPTYSLNEGIRETTAWYSKR